MAAVIICFRAILPQQVPLPDGLSFRPADPVQLFSETECHSGGSPGYPAAPVPAMLRKHPEWAFPPKPPLLLPTPLHWGSGWFPPIPGHSGTGRQTYPGRGSPTRRGSILPGISALLLYNRRCIQNSEPRTSGPWATRWSYTPGQAFQRTQASGAPAFSAQP